MTSLRWRSPAVALFVPCEPSSPGVRRGHQAPPGRTAFIGPLQPPQRLVVAPTPVSPGVDGGCRGRSLPHRVSPAARSDGAKATRAARRVTRAIGGPEQNYWAEVGR